MSTFKKHLCYLFPQNMDDMGSHFFNIKYSNIMVITAYEACITCFRYSHVHMSSAKRITKHRDYIFQTLCFICHPCLRYKDADKAVIA